jgi:ABC-type molybdate transport system substrate-binding protein
MAAPGGDIVGRLPAEIGEAVTFSAGRFAASRKQDAAVAFLRFLAAAAMADLLRGKGLERPPGPQGSGPCPTRRR